MGKGSVLLKDSPSSNPEVLVEGRREEDRQTAAGIGQKRGKSLHPDRRNQRRRGEGRLEKR